MSQRIEDHGSGESPGRDALTLEALRCRVAELLETEPAGVTNGADLIRLGMDSLRVMKIAAIARKNGVQLSFAELLERPSLTEWWALISESSTRCLPTAAHAAETDEEAPFQLATMQHAYWIGRLDGQPLGVASHFYFEFDGTAVDAGGLERAARAVVRRHSMLRARFLEDGRQQIMPETPWPGVTVYDLQDLSIPETDEALASIRKRESHRRLDVGGGEVFDIQLSLLPGRSTRLHVNIDMLVADAQSFRTLMGEVARLYGDPEEILPPISYSFPRYLRDRETGMGERRERAKNYWKERLADFPGAPQLPLRCDPASIENPQVTRREHWLSRSEWDQIAQRAQSHGLTLSMVFATAFSEVLAAWSSTPRFVLNLPLFDRRSTHPDVSQLVGDFTSLILLEVDASGRRGFWERAVDLQSRFRRDAAHAEYSGVEVARDLAHLRRGELVSAPVVFTSALGMGELFGDGVQSRLGRLSWMISQTSQVWLDHQVTEQDGGLLLNWDAVDSLFPDGVLDDMFSSYQTLLAELAAPGADRSVPTPVGLPSRQAATRARVNATAAVESGRLLHEGFFAHAAAFPDRPALVWGDSGELSYGELGLRARRVARLLLDHGLEAGDRVALGFPRGSEQIQAVLGVLCAGGVYVPIGVEQPKARRERICKRAGVRMALTSESIAAGWPECVDVLALEDAYRLEPIESSRSVAADALAYVLFTSGSTGEPKGVMISHRAAMNTIEDLNARFDVGPNDRVLAISALDFDLSVYDIFGLLSAGGSLALIDEASRREAKTWAHWVRKREVTIWQSVPALLDMLLVAAEEEKLGESLRLILLGGDWIGLDLPKRLASCVPGCRFVALGGATETAIHSTVCEIDEVPDTWGSIPYGVPLRNVRCRVVDVRGRDCPDWVAGELWIGGASVAQGYRGDPERTARQFVEHDGVRWYRSGDLSRYWPDGTIEFLGRMDHQVKIRGYRVELGEVETALERDPGVDRAVALAIGARGSQRLVAAIVSFSAEPDLQDIRSGLLERLPPHMVPDRLITVPALPLTANGKIDRNALRAGFAPGSPEPAEASRPPEGPIESELAGVWKELLGVPEVSRSQSFFVLGGDSLLATRLVQILRRRFATDVSLRQLFDAPTIAALGSRISASGAGDRTAAFEEGVV